MLRTARLLLRPWRDEDRTPCAAMTADAEVMRFFGLVRDRAASDAWIDRTIAHWQREGFGLWAVAAPGVAPFIGFVGLSRVPAWMPCAGGVEAVWTLDAPYWRRGYAAEAATAALADGFARLDLAEIVAFTAVVNLPSRAVMHHIGMIHDPADDFDHPKLPADSPFRRHVLMRAPRP
jgi:ribosomal-protein-alanine N-acetyltransferase